jgi:NTP pyrophosphatase (non-canonical NTP hydrolase)
MSSGDLGRESVGQLSLDEIVDVVTGIYSEKDECRSVWDIWLHATHHAAAIGEEVRKYKPGKRLLEEIADFSMWLFTFAGKIKGQFKTAEDAENNKKCRVSEFTIQTEKEFSEIVWNKYPRACPVCFWRRTNNGSKSPEDFEKPCDCLIYNIEDRDKAESEEEKAKKKAEKQKRVGGLRAFAKQQSSLNKKPATIDDWQKMFGELFEANLRHVSLVDIGFHLLEEVGEVSDAIVRMYSYTEAFNGQPRWNQIWLEEEIADVFSWLLTLVNSLQMMPDIAKEFVNYLELGRASKIFEEKIMLSTIIWQRYGNNRKHIWWCPSCEKQRCICDLKWVGENMDYAEFLEYTKNDPLA